MRIPLIPRCPLVRGDANVLPTVFAFVIGALVLASGAGPATLFAQNPPATDSGFVTVKGVIADSLHGGYLADAIVAVSGSSRMATTDSLGRFRINGVQPGTRRMDVYHSRLDELGVALITPLIELKAGDSVSLGLAFPSASTIVGMLCRGADRSAGPAAVFGQVLDADLETPIAGARLSIDWVEYKIEKKRLKTSFEQRSAVSAPDGHFRFCGLPGELIGNLSASFGGDTTAKVEIRVDSLLAARTLHLAPIGERSTTQASGVPVSAAGSSSTALRRRSGSLSGRIVNPSGAPVSRARVAIDRLNAVALSGDDGRFALYGIRPGTRTLTVRRIGFEPVEIPVEVSADSPRDITVRLADFVPTLDTVVVTAIRDRALDRVGFLRRRKSGTGTYLSPEQLQKLHAIQFVDLFNSVPMLRRSYESGRPVLVGRPRALTNSCINYFVDGAPWFGAGIEEFMQPGEVAAIEVYDGAFTPGEFTRGFSACGTTVVLWTKPRLGIP
jgi:hypothetical protein